MPPLKSIPRVLSRNEIRVSRLAQRIKPSDCTKEMQEYIFMMERANGDCTLIPARVSKALEDCGKGVVSEICC
jgi:hypothetical protein